MSHTNETLHYGLPQFIGTDILDPLTDTNEAYQKIDETMYEVAQQGAQAEEDSAEAKQIAQGIDGRVTIVENEVVELGTGIVQTRAMIAAPFDALKVDGYEVGEYVTFDDKLYKFIKKHTGTWSASDVNEVAICDDAVRIRKMVAPFFDPNKQGGYEAGAWVIYNDALYVFTADHSGAWTGLDVDAIDIGYAVDRVEGTLHYPTAGEEVVCGYTSDNEPVYRKHLNNTVTTKTTSGDVDTFTMFTMTGVKKVLKVYGGANVVHFNQPAEQSWFIAYGSVYQRGQADCIDFYLNTGTHIALSEFSAPTRLLIGSVNCDMYIEYVKM